MIRVMIICLLAVSLLACAHVAPSTRTTPPIHVRSELAQGKRFFNDGYYKRAMRILLPLACDGNAEAQYAVGYMYYYGLGVAQDTEVGYFWIRRSADNHYWVAQEALHIISPA